MKSACLSAALLVLTVSATAQVVVVHDPTKNAPASKMTAAEQAVFESNAISAVKKTISKDVCEPDVEVAGVARGAFSRPGSSQTLVFYQYCQTGNGFGEAGLVLIENGKVAGNFIADTGWTMTIERVADINRNGLDEFTLAYSGGLHQGQGGAGVDLMEFAHGIPVGLGWYQSESFADTQATTVWKLTAKPGAAPVYYRQKFLSGEGEKYRAIGAAAPFRLGKAISKFEAVR